MVESWGTMDGFRFQAKTCIRFKKEKHFSEVFYSVCSPELVVRINDSAKDNDAIKELPGNDGHNGRFLILSPYM